MRWLHTTRPPDERGVSSLAPVRIFTAEIELDGFIAPTGQRVTDMLLRGQDLAFLPAGARPEPENWVAIGPNAILVVIPPPLPDRPDVPAELDHVNVEVEVETYRITGTVRVPRGEPLGLGMRRRQAFVPLTSATLTRAGGPPESVEVAIVNLARAAAMRRTD